MQPNLQKNLSRFYRLALQSMKAKASLFPFIFLLLAANFADTRSYGQGCQTPVVTPNPFKVEALETPGICQNTQVTFTTPSIPAVQYIWSVSPGTSGIDYTIVSGGGIGDTIVVVNFINPHTFYVVHLNTNDSTANGVVGCGGAIPTSVTVNANPVASASNNGPLCSGATLSLFSSPNALNTYVWSGPNSFSSSSQNPVITAATTAASGLYTVSVTDANGCSGTASTTVQINPAPTVDSVSNQVVCNKTATAAVNFTSPDAGTVFNWTNNNTTIGLPASGTGNIASFTATNSTNTPDTATITVTPKAGSLAYIANAISNTVSVINIAANLVVATIPVGSGPGSVSVSPDGSRVYVTNEDSNSVSVISTATNSVIATIPVSSEPEGISVSPDGSRVYVTNANYDIVSVINTATNTVIATVPVGANPEGISITPDGSQVYVTNKFDNTVSVINTTTNTVVATVPVGRDAYGISITPDGSRVYVTNTDDNTVSVINTATNTVVATVPVGTNPEGISITPDGSRVYVTNANSNSVSVINTATNTVIATVPVGAHPEGISITPDGSQVCVANFTDGTISEINTATNTVAATVTVGSGPVSFGNFITNGPSACPGTAKTFTITVNPNPVATITGPSSFCTYNGQGYTYITYTTDAGMSGYVWTFSGTAGTDYTILEGGTSNDYFVTMRWNTPGNQTVNVSYTNPSFPNCTVTPASIATSVSGAAFTIVTSDANNSDICQNTQVTYTVQPATAGATYNWTIQGTPGTDYNIVSGGGSTDISTVINWITPGHKGLQVSDTIHSTGCTFLSTSPTINVLANPTPTASNNGPVCAGAALSLSSTPNSLNSYTWSGPNSFSSSSQDTVIASATTAASGLYTVSVTDRNGCTGTAATTVTVNSIPVPAAFNNGPVCTGTNLNLSSTPNGLSSYNWTGPNSFTSSAQNPGITAATTAASGLYTLKVTDANGCTGTATTTATVNPNPVATITGPTNACGYNYITYTTETGMSNYVWTVSGIAGTDYDISGGGTSNDDSVTLRWKSNGNQTVTVSYTNPASPNCTVTAASITTSVDGAIIPAMNIGANTVCQNTQVTYSVQQSIASVLQTAGVTCNWSVDGTSGIDYTIISGGGPNDFSLVIQWITSGSKLVSFSYTTLSGCSKTSRASTTVNANPIPAAFNNGPVCTGTNLNLSSTPNGLSSYNWSGPNSFSSSSQNPAITAATTAAGGLYTLTVTDANGCTGTAATTVAVNANPVPAAFNNGPVCAGTNLTLSSTPNGLSSYNWSGPNSFSSSSQNPAITAATTAAGGLYTLNVTDGNGCTGTAATTVTVNSNPVPTAFNNGPVCTGTNLNLSSTPNGLTNYNWTGPNSFSSSSQNPVITAATSAAGGLYTVNVVDGNGCKGTATTTAAVNTNTITASVNAGTLTCNAATTTLTVTAGGGSAPYTYSLNGTGPYQAGNTFTVAAGNYTVTVKDASGCTKASSSITITQPKAITATAGAGTITCNGGTTTLTVTASGGTGTLTYSLTGTSYQASKTFTVAAGTYTPLVKDASGCIQAATPIIVAQPAAISINTSAGTISCYGGTTTLTITATGGTPGYTYSVNGCAFQSGNTFTVSATTCSVTVKDSKGCTAVKSVTITQPAAISVTASAGAILCNGGTSTVTVGATGGTPGYTGTGTFTKAAGTYTFTVTDSKGCSGSKTITISQPAALSVSLSSKTNVLCYGGNTGSIIVKAAGGTSPYTYKINTAATYQTSSTFSSLTAATYSVTVKDNNGCTAVITGIAITQPASTLSLTLVQQVNVSCLNGTNRSIKVNASGGTSPYKYSLNSGTYGTICTFSNLSAGTYTVTAEDANNCTQAITVVIKNGTGKCNDNLSASDETITGPAVSDGTWLDAKISPNPSKTQFTLILSGNSNEPVDIRVIDMYGRSVHYDRGSANQSYQFGQRFAGGLYIVQILQGKIVKTMKVVKGD